MANPAVHIHHTVFRAPGTLFTRYKNIFTVSAAAQLLTLDSLALRPSLTVLLALDSHFSDFSLSFWMNSSYFNQKDGGLPGDVSRQLVLFLVLRFFAILSNVCDKDLGNAPENVSGVQRWVSVSFKCQDIKTFSERILGTRRFCH